MIALRRRPGLPRAVQVTLALVVPTAMLACAGLHETDENCEEERAVTVTAPLSCEQLKKRATVSHDHSERERDAATRRASASFYAEYAERCVGEQDYPEMIYYYGELLWADASASFAKGDKAAARELFAQAHQTFRRTLELAPTRFTKDAAYAQMLALKNHLEYEGSDRAEAGRTGRETCSRDSHGACVPITATSDFPVSDYSDDEREMLAAYDLYTRHVDDKSDTERAEVVYHRARLAMIHNRFDEAEPAIIDLLSGDDDSKFHAWSAEMLTDLLTIRWVRAVGLEKENANAALSRWLKRVQTMKLYKSDESEKLRAALPALVKSLGR